MKRSISVLYVLFFLSLYGCSFLGITDEKPAGEKAITSSSAKGYIDYLASDSLKGRDTPSPELDSAAKFISLHFESAGLRPLNGSYFQKVKMGYIRLGKENFLKIRKGKEEAAFKLKDEFTPFEITADKEASAAVVFAGYGIDAPEYNYNDYENLDVKGKIVFVLRHEPGENDPASIFKGKELTKYSSVLEKTETAIKHGAIGVLICQDPLNHKLLTPRGFPWPSLSKFIPDKALPLSLLLDEKDKVPVVQVGEEVINYLFGSTDKLRDIQAGIDKNLKPSSFAIDGASATLKTSTELQDESADNVIGFIEGTDPVLKDEVLVIGAHYDHIGIKKNHAANEDYIFNGADDNASGTTALMEVADAFSANNLGPRRSILFIAFCGEEKGLFGSRYYVEYPLFPLSKTVAMLNIDMVGRNSIDSLSIFGAAAFPKITEIVKDKNSETGFNLVFDPVLNGGSDHMSFTRKKIPALFFHSGIHQDLHQVSDEVRFINYDKIAKAAKLVFRTAWQIANEGDYYFPKSN